MKYRHNKIKREHGIIENALEWLQELSVNPEVSDIIPGVIDVTHSPEKGIVYKYETATGCKLLLKSNGSVQEVFVVTKSSDVVKEWVQRYNSQLALTEIQEEKKLLDGHEELSKKKTSGKSKNKKRKSLSAKEKKPLKHTDFIGIKKNYELVEINKNMRDSFVDSLASMADLEDPKLGDKINPSTRQALKHLKQNLQDNAKSDKSIKQETKYNPQKVAGKKTAKLKKNAQKRAR